MINLRELNFVEKKRTLSTLQCGGRAKLTTIDNLLSLEATVRKAQGNSEYVVSIFFKMGKAYDLTWKPFVLIDIYEAGIEVRMFKFIQNLLKIRSFKLEVDEIISDTEIQIEGTPQRSVIIPTFFIQKNCI